MAATVVPTRRVLLDIGRRDDVFHLSMVDLESYLAGEWDGTGARELASDRKRARELWLEKSPPDVVVEGAEPGTKTWSPPASPTDGWKGVAVSSGRAEAIARVVRHPKDGGRLGEGEILVAPSTDPGWTPLSLKASALVMESGGYLSHGAIVAREFGIPAVVNVPGILDRVEDGERLSVDGDRGTVARLEAVDG